MSNTINVTGTGGIIEGNLGAANVNVNLDSTLLFDSNDDKITTGNLGSLGQATSLSSFAWVKLDATPSTSQYIWSTLYAPVNFVFSGATGLRFQGKRGDTDALANIDSSGPFTFTTGDWYHVGFTYDNSSRAVLFYINGVQYAGGTFPAALKNVNSDLILGNYGAGTNMIQGNLADVKIFNSVISATDAKILAAKINQDPALTSANANVIGWWKINEGTGTTINDFTNDTNGGTDHNGTLANGTWQYDQYSVDVYDNSTTTDGTFTVTQGKVEGKALSSLALDGNGDFVNLSNTGGDLEFGDGSNDSPFTLSAWIKADDATSGAIYSRQNELAFGLNGSDKLYLDLYDGTDSVVERQASTDTFTSNENLWTHVVGTYSGVGGTSANAGIKLYINGVAIAMTAGDSGSYTAMHNDINADSKIGAYVSGDYFDGDIRDFKLFDYELSAEQVASMYSNTYPQTPYHGYKMDEGVGQVNATDYGTSSTTINGTLHGNAAMGDSNGTLDLDGSLTIAANGTLSAPRGNLDVGGNMASNGALTHNNGKFRFTEHLQVTGTSLTFYNMSWDGSNIKTIDLMNDTTIENQLDGNNQWRLKASSNTVTLTMGTATSQGTIDTTTMSSYGVEWDSNTSNFVKIRGVNSLFPAIITGTNIDWDDVSGGLVRLENCDFQGDITTGGGGVTITLTGDCEFDAVTVSSGDTLDLNEQRVECSNSLSILGTCDLDNALIYMTGAGILNDDGTDQNAGTCTLVQQGTSTTVADPPTGVGTFLYNQPSVTQTIGRIANTHIIGCGTQHLSGTPSGGSLTIATGATVDANDETITLSGDFTTSGGLLGASCLSLDRSNTEYVEVADHADLDFPFNRNKLTAECWFKTSRSDDYQYLFDRRNGQDIFYLVIADNTDTVQGRVFTNGTTTNLVGSTVITDGKWHHAALVYDGTHSGSTTTAAHKLYVDGKLEAEELASGSIYSGTVPLRFGSRYNNIYFMDGEIDEIRLFAAAKTAAQIREDMFTAEGTNLTHFNSAADASTDGLVGRWGCNEGTGSALSCSNSNLNGVIYDYNSGSPATVTDAWAGAGTFTGGTSTVVMAKSGTQTINFKHLANDFDSLTINAGSTTQLKTIGDAAGNSLQDVNENLVVNGTLRSDPSDSSRLRIRDPNATFTVGSSVKTTALADLANLVIDGNGTFNVPELTTKTINITSSGTQVSASGPLTLTTELEVNSGTTFNANTNTIAAKTVDVNGGSLDLRNSTLNFSVTNSGDDFALSTSSTLLTGNTTIAGHSSATPTPTTVGSAGNFEVVGDVSNLAIQGNGDLTVIGSVTGCTLADSTANIRQFFHTLDTQQLLDADEAGDDDLRLTKPALDNALELMTK